MRLGLQWELIDIRRKQLRNTWQQIVLRDRAEEEERAFFREQARAQAAKARADAIKYAEEHAEDILRRRGLTAVTGIGRAELADKENNFKAGKPATLDVTKKKPKKKEEAKPETTDESSEEAPTHAPAKPKPKPKEKPAAIPARSVALPKKPRKEAKPALALPNVPEEELVDDFPVDFGLGSPLPALDDDNDLLNILSQDKASDDSDMDNEPSMASLILPVSSSSPARARLTKPAPRALTPTPQKRKRKPAAADDEDFDFTRKGEQKRAALAEQNQVEEEPEPTTVTPKKALKRRKELEKERVERLNGVMSKSQDASAGRVRSLMEEVASSGVAKIKNAVKTTSAKSRANGTSLTRPSSAVNAEPASIGDESAGDEASSLADRLNSKAAKSQTKSDDTGANDADARFSGVTMRSKKGAQDKSVVCRTNGAPKNKQVRSMQTSKADPAVKSLQQRQMQQSDLNDESNGDSSDDVGGGKAPTQPPIKRLKKSAKDKRSKMNEVEQALRKAEMLTRISQMQQDVATPKVAKKKKVLKKSTASTLAAKRAEFQQILTDAPAGNGSSRSLQDQPINVQEPEPSEQRRAAGTRRNGRDATPTQPKESTPPPEKLQFLQFTKGLSKSPMPFNLRSKLKSPVLASPMRKRPRAPVAPPEDQDEDVGMSSPAYSYGNGMSPRDSIADLTRAAASDNTSRQVAVGITTRPKKKKTATAPKVNRFGIPGGLITSTGGSSGAPSGGFSMFDAFVNTGDAPIPRLKTTSSGDMSPVV